MQVPPIPSSNRDDHTISVDTPYFPLLRLAEVWASVAGLPVEMVLRNLCDWTMMGAFPPDALVTPAGDRVDPFDIFMSRKALAGRSRGVSVGGTEIYGSLWGLDLLATVLVSVNGVRAFCKRTNTFPPFISSGSSKPLKAVVRRKHLAPPACPEADEQAAKYHARQSAHDAIEALRDILRRGEGAPTKFGPPPVGDRPVNAKYWQKQWTAFRDDARSNIEICGEAQLQRERDALDARWAEFVSAEMQEKSAVSATLGEGVTCTHGSDAEKLSSAARSAGRYSAAEAETWYESWILSNTRLGVIPTREDDWVAAKEKLGEGVPREAIRELRRCKAPSSWQKKGRRKSANETGGRE